MGECGADLSAGGIRMIDVNCFVGAYPFRGGVEATPESLLARMDQIGVTEAWVSHLAAIFWRDPTEGNAALLEAAESPRLRPVLAVHPGLTGWEQVLDEVKSVNAPCVRADPMFYGIDPAGADMVALADACAARGLPLMMAVKLEDLRQRHPNDAAADLAPWAVRTLIRRHPKLRLIITHADRDFIEQVHFGSTPEEAGRILWDVCWIWGPPEEHLALLLETVGVERFCFGTATPMRLPENSVAKLDLLDIDPASRLAIEEGNARAVAGRT
jgi:predicted TIM-barrel fold metal-dependent hydrolase